MKLLALWLALVLLCFVSAQKIVTKEDAMKFSRNMQKSFETCIGHHSLILLAEEPNFGAESIDKMFDIAKSAAEIFDLGGAAGMFTGAASILMNAFYPKEDAVAVMKKGFAEVNKGIQEIQASIAKLGHVMVGVNQLSKYKEYRSRLSGLSTIYNTWMRRLTDKSAHKKFVDACFLNQPILWFTDVRGLMNNELLPDLAYSMMEFTDRLRWPITQMARIVKSDMCEAVVMLSACENAHENSEDLRKDLIEQAQNITRKVAERFRHVDQIIVTTAPAEIQKHLRIAEKVSPAFKSGEINDYFYNYIKGKYYWLKLNVNAYQRPRISSGSYYSWNHKDANLCTIETSIEANGKHYTILVVAWRKDDREGYSTNLISDNTSRIVAPYGSFAHFSSCDEAKDVLAADLQDFMWAKGVFSYWFFGYRNDGAFDCDDIICHEKVAGDKLFDRLERGPFGPTYHAIFTKFDYCETWEIFFRCKRLIFSVAAINCKKSPYLKEAFTYP